MFQRSLLTLLILLLLSNLALAASRADDEDDDDEEDETPAVAQKVVTTPGIPGKPLQRPVATPTKKEAPFSLTGVLLGGGMLMPGRRDVISGDNALLVLGVLPAWQATESLAVFGVFRVNQGPGFREPAQFNQSDLGLRWQWDDGESFFQPEINLSAMLPINASERENDFYQGGLAPGFRLVHDEAFEWSLGASYHHLWHEEPTTVNEETNIQYYWLFDTAIEIPLGKELSIGGELNLAIRHFGAESHEQIGFDIHGGWQLSKNFGLLAGFGNYPVPRLPLNPDEPGPRYDASQDMVYAGMSVEF